MLREYNISPSANGKNHLVLAFCGFAHANASSSASSFASTGAVAISA